MKSPFWCALFHVPVDITNMGYIWNSLSSPDMFHIESPLVDIGVPELSGSRNAGQREY